MIYAYADSNPLYEGLLKVGFAIRYPDRYPGEFREDGDPVDADLVFFYFCAPAGLFSY